MMTYKRLRNYDTKALKNKLEIAKKAIIKYQNEKELAHERMTIKTIEKIEKILKERECE